MKISFTLLLFLLPFWGLAQNSFPIDPETKKVLYQDVISVDSVSATELNKRAKNWLFSVIKSPKTAIEIDDNSILAANITYDYENNPSLLSKRARLYIPLRIEFKDGRYRYTITNLKYGSDAPGYTQLQWPLEKLAFAKLGKSDQRSAEGMNQSILGIIQSLKTALTTKTKDW